MKLFKYITLTAVAVMSIGYSSCNKDDEYFDDKYQSEAIQVNKVFLEDAESSVPDREVTFARLGQMIRLEGSGFMGMKKVYVNGYETYFNRAYVTNTSMLVTLNSKTPITDADEEVRNTIRLVKDGTETVYDFIIRAASPAIKSMSNTLPLAGETVVVYGANLQEVISVSLPGGTVVTEGITSDEDGEWFSFTMPSGISEGGSITAEGANGIAQSAAFFNERRGMIQDFEDSAHQGAWGGKDDDGNIKPGASMIYPEDLVEDPFGLRGKVWQVVPDRLLAGDGIASGKPRATECWTVGDADRAYEDWSRMSFIPADTPLADLAFQFDIYCPDPWNMTGQIEIAMINNYNFAGKGSDDDNSKGMTAFFIPWAADGVATPFFTEGWTTVTIPLNEFGKYNKDKYGDDEFKEGTFQNVIDDRLAATYPNFGMGFVNSDFKIGDVEFKSTAFTGPKIYIDNWRIVPNKTVVISDYPEDEEE